MSDEGPSIDIIAGNDCLQILRLSTGGSFMHHDRITLDQRAKLMVSLVQAWGAAHVVSEAMKQMHEHPHTRSAAPTIESLVFIAADTADAIYSEAQKRGWSLQLPSFVGAKDE